ncbi:uncharacterized protein DNG_05370 [Cephalotrichum gorgonifer]|uniref:PLP-dependent transferase n=1 Tax=Cephalotrichum gorgonifer TaxID=2041049 RepID=A0AAE8N0R6_9PEZI|nr:uncharacterized protein DNG_05370 [Cephalotrichum gorgonifer]
MTPYSTPSITTITSQGVVPPRTLAVQLSPTSSADPDLDTVKPHRCLVTSAHGHYVYLDDGRRVLDACGGAAVACLGYGQADVLAAMMAQASAVPYVPWGFFDNLSTRQLSEWLSQSTGGALPKAYILSSGSEASEAALKLSREYFVWRGESNRVNYIARHTSYHGSTIGALSLSGHTARRAPFEGLLTRNVHRISSCNPYRQRRDGESDADFCARKAQELEDAFLQLGPETVAAFVAEPVVGAAMGCVPAVPGYFKAMRAVCDKYGALLILDEVMCGMGRTGTLHAWEQEGVIPDLQTVGKGLGGGYQPVSALLVGRKVAEQMQTSGAVFTHGHTYQDFPVGSAAALKVQQIVQDRGLLQNVKIQGEFLGRRLKEELGQHPNVGDIRGRGLFWGVEFVANRDTKEPFDDELEVARKVHLAALQAPFQVMVYFGQGCAGGRKGDHIMVCPAYDVSREEVEMMESYFTYAGEERSPVDHNVHWRQGIGAGGEETFLPRTLIYDFRGCFGALSKGNPLYDEGEDTTTNSWNGEPLVRKEPLIPKSTYHNALDSGDVPSVSSSTVRYWSDFSRTYFHPRSIVQVSDLDSSSSSASPTLDTFEQGKDLFAALDAEDDVLDQQLRPFVEECDHIQGLQIIGGGDDGWSGFGSSLLEKVRDEFGKTCIWYWMPEATPSSGPRSKRLARALNRAKVLSEVHTQASTVIPLCIPSASRAYYTLNADSPWQVSALLSTALESAALSTRLRSAPTSLSDLSAALNVQGRHTISRLRMGLGEDRKGEGEVEGEEAVDAALDIDLFSLTGDVAGKASFSSSYGRVLSQRGELSDEVYDALFKGDPPHPATQRYTSPLIYPLPDSFPPIFSSKQGLTVDTLLSTDPHISRSASALRKRVIPYLRGDERELVGNALADIGEEYHDGWESEDSDDD